MASRRRRARSKRASPQFQSFTSDSAESGFARTVGRILFGVGALAIFVAFASIVTTDRTGRSSTAVTPAAASLFNPGQPVPVATPASLRLSDEGSPGGSSLFDDKALLSLDRKTDTDPLSEPAFVNGRKVPLRNEPRVGAAVLDRLNDARAVTIIERRDDWARVRDETTQREGWLPAKRLAATRPESDERQPEPPPSISPKLTTAAIAKLLIAESLSGYSGSCPCPYNTDRAGRSCGARSAYARPRGAAPLCFAHDVTSAMIAAYRERR